MRSYDNSEVAFILLGHPVCYSVKQKLGYNCYALRCM